MLYAQAAEEEVFQKNLLTTIPLLTKEWKLTLEFRPSSSPSCRQFFFMQRGDHAYAPAFYGSCKSGTWRVHFDGGKSADLPSTLKVGEWTKIEYLQVKRVDDIGYDTIVSMDGEELYNKPSPVVPVMDYKEVEIWINFNQGPMNGTIRKLTIQ